MGGPGRGLGGGVGGGDAVRLPKQRARWALLLRRERSKRSSATFEMAEKNAVSYLAKKNNKKCVSITRILDGRLRYHTVHQQSQNKTPHCIT